SAGARLIVAGDPTTPVERTAGVDWRLAWLSEQEVDRAHAEATVAVFPYRPELDQSGSLLRALGSGVPAVVYDVGGLAEPDERYGDYADVLDLAAAHLAELRDGFAATLEDPAGYVRAFDRAAAKRYPQLAEALKET